MHRWLASVLILVFAAAPALAAPATTPFEQARCEVWARELSFAQSVADNDGAAFAAHLHPQAVFGATRARPQRGRDEILRAWKGLIDGTAAKLWWYPDRVHASGDGTVVSSSGPSLYQDPATGAYGIGRFNSIWQRGDDGVWRIVFDDGQEPQPADEAQVQTFHAGRVTDCPPG